MRSSKIELFAACLASASLLHAAEDTLAGRLARYGLSFAGAGCSLEREYARGDCSAGHTCFSTITGACGGARLRFEIVSGVGEKEALKYMASRFTRVRMLYGGRAEYPGMVTARTEVPQELAPRYAEKGPLGRETLYMPASAGLAYGAGARDLVKYSAALSYRYCAASRTLGQIEAFVPAGAPDSGLDALLAGFDCTAEVKADGR